MKINFKDSRHSGPATGLCKQCSSSHIRTDFQNVTAVWCSIGSNLIPIEKAVIECSGYEEKGTMTEWEAKQIGWVLELKGDRVIGFKAPKKNNNND